MTEATDLRAARGVIADAAQHDDATLAGACRLVLRQSREPGLIEDARALLTRLTETTE